MPKLIKAKDHQKPVRADDGPRWGELFGRRRERLAVNLCDCDRIDPTIRGILLSGKLDLSDAIRTDPQRMDEVAVAFSCDLLVAACIVDTLRFRDRSAGVHPTRCYVNKSGSTWVKIGGSQNLTELVGEKIVLSSEIFSPDVRPDEIRQLKAVRIEL